MMPAWFARQARSADKHHFLGQTLADSGFKGALHGLAGIGEIPENYAQLQNISKRFGVWYKNHRVMVGA
jgi:hypothetical protein